MTEAKELDPAVRLNALDEAIETLRFNVRHLIAEDDKDDALRTLEVARDVMASVAETLASLPRLEALTAPVALEAGWNTDLDAMPHALTLLFKAHDPDEPEGVVSLGIRGEEPQRLIAWSFLPSAIHPAPSREAVIVQRIECVTFQNGYEEPADPIWRIEIGGICADFDTQTHAENFATAIRSLPSNAPSLGEARLAEGEAVAWRYLERGEWKYVGGLIKPQPGNSYPVEPLYSHPSHVQAEAGEAMKPTFGTPSGYVEVPPADLKGDEELARHWIDRYACGIDAEPQMNRIRAALNKGL